jgi:micrococcal nuclease
MVMVGVTAMWCAFGVFFTLPDGNVTADKLVHLLRLAGLGALAAAASCVRRGYQPKKTTPVQRLLRRVPSTAWVLAVGLLEGAAAGYAAFELPPNSVDGGRNFDLCRWAFQQNCVIDGDTIRYDGVKIRLADIDTPETSRPKCAFEAALGHKAKRRLLELMNAGPLDVVSIGGPDVDRYGRQLRVIKRGGHSIADTLVAEGLARHWDGARRSWCG